MEQETFQDINSDIVYLTELSKIIYKAYNNHAFLVQELNNISNSNRQKLWSKYQQAEGPVKKVRGQVAEILTNRNISEQDLGDIIKNAKAEAEDTDAFSRLYKEWYNVLYMFILAEYKDDMNRSIASFRQNVSKALGHPIELTSLKFDFTGERETGSTRMWIPFFNSTHKKQDTAKQLFVSIEDGQLMYSFYDRPNNTHIEQKNIADGQQFDSRDLIQLFSRYLPQIQNDIVNHNSTSEILLHESESVYKISMGPKDVTDDCFDYLIGENLVMVHSNTKPLGQTQTKQGDIFAEEMNIGDYIYICRGNKLILIGRLTSDPEPVEYDNLGDEGWIQRRFESISTALKDDQYRLDQKWWAPNFRSTCWPIPVSELEMANKNLFYPFFGSYFKIANANATQSKKTNDMETLPLNTILYGPPGTGKTYNAIEKSIAVINSRLDEDKKIKLPSNPTLRESRRLIKAEYDKLVKKQAIFFTTFHQSMSYEDFIEGLKPVTAEDEETELKYKLAAGIFKTACAAAAHNCYKRFTIQKPALSYTFDQLYDDFVENINTQLNQTNRPSYKTLRGKEVEIKKINRNSSIIAGPKGSNAKNIAPLTKENLQKLYDKFKDVQEIESLKQVKDTVAVVPRTTEFYAIFNGLKEFEKGYQPDVEVEEFNIEENLTLEDLVHKFDAEVFTEAIIQFGDKAEAVVLIIDEINRGNISQIFGELITLIEDDKRLGNKESLSAILPYSKKNFSVPPNLYIIGTMNTADRSVEALDAALRRRFSFEFTPPVPEKVPETIGAIALRETFIAINERIRFLLDDDHQIGHSYFMGMTEEVEVKEVFKNKILPLLKEYFYNDFGKIRLVLGDGFVQKQENYRPRFAAEDSMELDRDVFTITSINKEFNIADALKITLGRK